MEFHRNSGTGNIDESYHPPGKQPFRLVFLRVHFERLAGAGTDVADLSVSVDDNENGAFNAELWRQANAGVAADTMLGLSEDFSETFIIPEGQDINVAWTNPDSPDIRWGLSMGVELV